MQSDFVNSIVLEDSHVHSFTHYLWMLSPMTELNSWNRNYLTGRIQNTKSLVPHRKSQLIPIMEILSHESSLQVWDKSLLGFYMFL